MYLTSYGSMSLTLKGTRKSLLRYKKEKNLTQDNQGSLNESRRPTNDCQEFWPRYLFFMGLLQHQRSSQSRNSCQLAISRVITEKLFPPVDG